MPMFKVLSVESTNTTIGMLESIGFEYLEEPGILRLIHPKWKWALEAEIDEGDVEINVVELSEEEETDSE